jgi:two-component system, cell cycle sensor histidine kinase and response regulator CckA
MTNNPPKKRPIKTAKDITKNKLAKKSTDQSERKYKALIDTTGTGYVILDSNGNVLDANPEYVRLTGHRSLDEIAGRPVVEWTAPHHRKKNSREVKKCLEKGSVRNLEIDYIDQTGHITPIEINATLFDSTEERQILALVKDITERKKAEVMLQKNRSDLMVILDNLPFLAWLKDSDGRFIAVNVPFAHASGHSSPEDLIGKTDLDIWPKTLAESYRADDNIVMLSRKKKAVEEIISDQGVDKWFETYKAPLFDMDGKVTGTTGFARDISDRKRAEEALRESEKRFRILFEESNVSIIIHDKDSGEVIDANTNMLRRYGINTLDELKANDFWMGPPYSFQVALEWIHKADREGPQRFEWLNRKVTGELFWEDVLLSKITINGIERILATTIDVTDRKKAEHTLKESEERYRRITKSITDYIYTVSIEKNNVIKTVHGEGCVAITGYSAEEFAGDPSLWIHMVVPEDRAMVAEQARRILAKEEAPVIEHRITRKDGIRRWIRNTIVPRHNDQGELIFYDGLIQDITERKTAEEKISMLSSVVEQSTEGMAIANLEGKLIFVNNAWCVMHGYKSPEELLGKSLAISHNQEQLETEVKPFNENVMKLGAYSGEVGHITKDGKAFSTFMTTTLLKDKQGTPYALAGIARDITERKEAEEALKISEEKHRLLFENSSDAIFVAQDEKVIFPNPQLPRLLGYTYEELNGAPFSNFIHPDDVDMVVERHKKRLKGDTVPETYSFRAVTKSGEILWVEVSKVLITWEGRPATLSFLRDITQQKKMEEQLLHAQKMEAIGTLAGGVAHDFNNLLMGILGYTSLMLMKTDTTHPFYEKLKTIERQVESGAELTRQLLGFARGGKYEVKPVNVNDLIIKTSDIFGRTKKEITIHKKLQEDLNTIEADRGQVEQVLFNLYVNAWQAMPSGGRLYLETQNVILDEQQCRAYNTKPGPYIKITVTDTGVGMDSEIQKRIFEPFFSTKGIGKGTGLGLASVYGIIRNHGGIINVYSEKGHGTNFTLYLPASGAKADAEKPNEDRLLTGDETILLVDDEPINIGTIKELLEALGYNILTALSGEEAINLYRKHFGKIRLVILDMIMPEMSGKETLIELMELDKDVCVLLASGYSIDGEAQTIIDLGCKGFIQKPFRVEELSQKIRDVLDSRAA